MRWPHWCAVLSLLPAVAAGRMLGDPAALFAADLDELLAVKIRVASRTDASLLEAASVVSLITAADIRQMGARDLRDVLRQLPGFELGIRVFGYPEFGLRGVLTDNTEKILILLDGLPVNEHLEGSGTIVFGDFTLENIERIEVIRGPGSALYGTNAFVGVINLISKPALRNGMEVQLDAGNFDTQALSWRAGWQQGDWSGSAFLHYLDSEGDRQTVAQDAVQIRTDAPWFSDLNADISLAGTSRGTTDYWRRKLTAQLQLGYQNWRFHALLVDAEKGPYIGPLFTLNEHSLAQPRQLQADLSYHWQLSDKWQLEPRLYWRHYVADNLWNLFPDGYRIPDGSGGTIDYTRGQYDVNGATQQTRGIEVKTSAAVTDAHTVSAGIAYEHHLLYDIINRTNVPGYGPERMMDAPPIMLGEPDRRLQTVYLQDEWQVVTPLTVTAGLRMDRYSDAGTSLTPRLALVWQPAPELSLKALSGEGFRAPTFVESYLYAYGGFARGNADNQPETIRTDELVAVYRFTPDTLLQLNVFRNRIRDLLRLVPNANGYLEYQNQPDETRIEGVEAELRWQLSEQLGSHLNYSHESSEDGAGEPLLGMARWRLNLGLNYAISDHWNMNLLLHAVGDRARASFDQRTELDGYRIWDLSVGYQPSRHFHWQLSLHNLFDSEQRFPDISGGVPEDFPWEGRSVQLRLRWQP